MGDMTMTMINSSKGLGTRRLVAVIALVLLVGMVLGGGVFATDGADEGIGDVAADLGEAEATVKDLVNLIFNGVIIVIACGGVIFGGYNFYEGWTNDQPEMKKKGIQTLIIVGVAIGVMFAAKGIVFRLIKF